MPRRGRLRGAPGARRAAAWAALLGSGVDAWGTGAFISAAMVLFTRDLGVRPDAVGLGLTLSAIAGLVASVPVAGWADRVGVATAFRWVYVLRAVGCCGWLLVDGTGWFLLYCALFGLVDRSAASLTRAMIVSSLTRAMIVSSMPTEEGVRVLGACTVPTTVGYSIGAAGASVVLWQGWPLATVVGANAASFLVVIAVFSAALRPRPAPAAAQGVALRARVRQAFDSPARRAIVVDNFLFSFFRAFLTFFAPLAVVTFAPAHVAVVPLLLMVNTAAVAVGQTWVNARARRPGRSAAFWGGSGVAVGAVTAAMAVVPLLSATGALVVIGVAFVVMVAAQMCHGAALAALMVRTSRPENLTTDLSAVNLGGQLQNMVGPSLYGLLVQPVGVVVAPLAGGVMVWRGWRAWRRGDAVGG
ncbi:hypothetical protein C1Y63_02505 [Corynebacterium sp. 13CS0277]|uniref:MFS transporter n=1 Tax=Corynebacterium sp. 13CS0277 TaxID=2071994 RepID=UPI000D02FF66|nr:MFS transporter [Corynebacterium sp. 13CS0277]PRQ12201.1 hypothetical protein C1Y63_02505 [Corynebacterium sp. 13CS0277]